jgi:hypothetical protein
LPRVPANTPWSRASSRSAAATRAWASAERSSAAARSVSAARVSTRSCAVSVSVSLVQATTRSYWGNVGNGVMREQIKSRKKQKNKKHNSTSPINLYKV